MASESDEKHVFLIVVMLGKLAPRWPQDAIFLPTLPPRCSRVASKTPTWVQLGSTWPILGPLWPPLQNKNEHLVWEVLHFFTFRRKLPKAFLQEPVFEKVSRPIGNVSFLEHRLAKMVENPRYLRLFLPGTLAPRCPQDATRWPGDRPKSAKEAPR